MQSILDFLFPKTSLRGKEGEWITKSELSQLTSHPRIFQKTELKKRGIKHLDHVFAVSTYWEAPLLKKAIHTFKYRPVPELGQTLGQLFSNGVEEFYPLREDACLCPVPLHFLRQFSRGFNQAEVLARALAQSSELPVRLLLTRWRPTGHQSRRNRGARWASMKGAFRVRVGAWVRMRCKSLPISSPSPNPNPSSSQQFVSEDLPYCVYLIDDLFTTGATMEECARVLKEGGVKRVEGIVLACS